eukprot:5466912-Amphidinium_carterae.1
MEMADLMSVSVHQRIIQTYLDAIVAEPIQGYAPISWAQIRRADDELIRVLADRSAGGLRRNVDGQPALDVLVPKILVDPMFVVYLTPLPKTSSAASSHEVPASSQRDSRPAAKRPQQAPAPQSQRPPKMAKGRGKSGKSGKSDRGSPMPPQLRGMMANTKDGRRI